MAVNESQARVGSPMWAKWKASGAVGGIKPSEFVRPQGFEQQEIAARVLMESGFPAVVSRVVSALENYTLKNATWDNDGNCTVKGIKGKPNSAGLVIKWGEERYPEIRDGELLGTTVAFRAAIVEAHADGTIAVRGKGISKKKGKDWTPEDWAKSNRADAVIHAIETPGYFRYIEPIPDAERENLVAFETYGGMNITDAAFRMIVLAAKSGKTVVTNFNDIGLAVNPGETDITKITDYYHEASRRRSEEYYKTSEAQHRERERQAEVRRDARRARLFEKFLAENRIVDAETKPQVGEMPTPRYLVDAPSTVSNGMTRWIGIEAYGTDGEAKKMLWWRNIQVGDLNTSLTRHDVAAFITRLKLETEADAAIGPAIDLSGSSPKTGRVQLVEEPGVYGVYIEAEKRPMFNFFATMRGIGDEPILRTENPVEFDELFQKAKAVLPMPKTPDVQAGSERVLDERIKFVVGDLTEIEADAIVCPSLPDLDVLYTGVAGAIMRKGGDRIFREARKIGNMAKLQNPNSEFPVPLYSALVTNGGNLPKAKHVIHSVAVNVTEEGFSCDPEAIFKSAWNVLETADTHHLASVAFPALGSGLYQVPMEQSFGAIAQAADRYLEEHPETTIEQVILVSRDPNLPKPSLSEELVADGWVRSLRNRMN